MMIRRLIGVGPTFAFERAGATTGASRTMAGSMPNTSTRHRDEAGNDNAATLRAVMRAWTKEIRRDMPLQMVLTFLAIAWKPGMSVQEYADMEGVSKSVMSRHILDLGERNRHMEPGLGLVEARPHPMSLRTHVVTLTGRGRRIMQAMEDTLALTHRPK